MHSNIGTEWSGAHLSTQSRANVRWKLDGQDKYLSDVFLHLLSSVRWDLVISVKKEIGINKNLILASCCQALSACFIN